MLKKANTLLSLMIVICLLYILSAPYLPKFYYFFKTKTDPSNGFVYESELAKKTLKDSNMDVGVLKPKPLENTLVIPSIGVDSKVYEGTDANTLDRGIWRRPNTSTPDQGGNTVLTAHRFMYTSGPNTFYNLDGLKKGDNIIVFWDLKEYVYTVEESRVVEPSETTVENQSKDSMLTLYTCTPLWTSSQRLVITAKLTNPI
jgi:sortase A